MNPELKDHMSQKLVTVNRATSAGDALRLMSNLWIRHLPVVDLASSHIVGILSERDLLRAPHTEIPAEELMSSPAKSFDINTPLSEVVEAMIDDKISAFLITQKDEAVGLITTEDMLIVLNELLRGGENKMWVLSELVTNPTIQQAAYIIGQTGI